MGNAPSMNKTPKKAATILRLTSIHRIHVWFVYLHLPQKSTIHVGKYTSPMDPKEDDHITRRVGSSLRPFQQVPSVVEVLFPSQASPLNLKINMEHNHGGLEDVVPQCFLCFFEKNPQLFHHPIFIS